MSVCPSLSPILRFVFLRQGLCQTLDSLRVDIFPQNPKNFAILAEGPVDEIRKLQEDIDAYINRLEAVALTASSGE